MRSIVSLSLVSAATSSFIVFGDWGTGSTLQKENAANINAHCATPGACDFVVGLADNFYNGRKSMTQRAFSAHRIPDTSLMHDPEQL